jgi:hypothetical protein
MSRFRGSYPKAPPHAHPLQQGGQYFQNSRASERPFQPAHSILSHPSQELPTRSSQTYSNSQRPRESNGATNYQKPRVTSKPSISKPSATITDYHQLHPFLQQASYDRRPFQPTSTSQRLERPSRNVPKLNTSTISHEVRRSPDTLYRPESRSPLPAYCAHPPQALKQSFGGRASNIHASEPASPFDSTKASQTSRRTSMASAHQKPHEPDVNGVSPPSSGASTPVGENADWALCHPRSLQNSRGGPRRFQIHHTNLNLNSNIWRFRLA